MSEDNLEINAPFPTNGKVVAHLMGGPNDGVDLVVSYPPKTAMVHGSFGGRPSRKDRRSRQYPYYFLRESVVDREVFYDFAGYYTETEARAAYNSRHGDAD